MSEPSLPKGYAARPEDARFVSSPYQYPLFWTCTGCFALVDGSLSDLHAERCLTPGDRHDATEAGA